MWERIRLKKSWGAMMLPLVIAVAAAVPAFAQDAAKLGLDVFEKRKAYGQGQFSDVREEDWFADNVAAVFEYGLMVGKGEDNFAPDGAVTVAEAITIAARLHKLYETGEDDFAQSSPWYQSYLDYADRQGLTVLWRSSGDLRANLENPATRSTLVELIGLALPSKAFPEINEVENGAILDL